MQLRRKFFVLSMVLVLITLSGCDSGIGPSQPGNNQGAEEGSGEIYYHYMIENPLIKFKIEPVIGFTIAAGQTPGSFDVTGMGQTYATLEMAGGTSTGLCWIQCEMLLRYTVDSKVELDEVNGDCKIPVSFKFVADNDESILTGDCPEQLMAVTNCAALSAVMVDPSLYTFTKEIRELDLPAEAGVTMRAEIKEVEMPRGLKGICNW